MKMKRRVGLLMAFLCLGVLFAPVEVAVAQGLSKTLYRDKVNGFKFRPPSKYSIVPARESLAAFGLLSMMDSEVSKSRASLRVVRLDEDSGGAIKAQLQGMRGSQDDDEEDDEDEEGKGEGKKGEESSTVGVRRATLVDYLNLFHKGSFNEGRIEVEKNFKTKGVAGLHRRWVLDGQILDAFSYRADEGDVHLLYYVSKEFTESRDGRKWLKMQTKSGRSFERIAKAKAVDVSTLSYAELLKHHKVQDAQYTGWRILPTPSKKYIVKTSSRRSAFIKNVITRLERSRKLFEEDFPPADFGRELTAISVVRVCGTVEEFHKYGSTRNGVAGWFNPSSEELVLYSGVKDKDNDALTYGVMSHEAFHQYCHFLFQRSEAHRWFDEGHGDYYAGAVWYKGKAYVKAEAEYKGINRLPGAQKMARDGTMVPLEEHLNFTHQAWSALSLRSYSQSWSIVYMLRQGALGNVPKQLWKEEYAQIIPHYMDALLGGYAKEYAKILEKRVKRAKRKKKELTEAERDISRKDLSMVSRNRVWKAAMEASWGAVDLKEFEAKWLDYVANSVK